MKRNMKRNVKRIVSPMLILLGGFGLAAAIVATGPTLQPQSPPSTAPLVRTWVAEAQAVRLNTRTHGTVLPRTESELVPEVSGRIVELSPAMVSGGFFRAGEVLFQIDPVDYELALEQARADLASARSELENAERGHRRQQNLARKQSTSESLRDDALNRLRVAEAGLRRAEAALRRAQRDLDRTRGPGTLQWQGTPGTRRRRAICQPWHGGGNNLRHRLCGGKAAGAR